ncbi:hypothetical protein FRX31_029612 [Thalictrum thalictroides]|uniref:Uncharacterized protein n=1 Tax=Thalictrum thalictroides TaxID=46969 RepID=A0A7J6V788_THATH|nr:hypothetical protein FRX31_029612 [Thalictrum thalictroides]
MNNTEEQSIFHIRTNDNIYNLLFSSYKIISRPGGTIDQGYGKVRNDMAKRTEINSQLKLLSVKDRRLRKILKLKTKDVNADQEA